MALTERTALGKRSEDIVAMELISRGYSEVARNVIARGGELDIVMRNSREIVFVEVRSRTDADITQLAESITKTKQRKVRLAAEQFLATTSEDYEEVRFFAALVTWTDTTPTVTIIEDAF